MEILIDYIVHLDRHLAAFAELYGAWIYVLLFLIVFAETGLVVTPFLPGDSLLFAAGALAAIGALDIAVVCLLLTAAAILGDALNYAAGRYVGPRVLREDRNGGFWRRALNHEHLQQAHDAFERFGGMAIVVGRFAPIVRTFVPFVAGAVSMTHSKFSFYNVGGAIVWVGTCAGAGYAFGNAPVVRNHFSLLVLAVIVISLIAPAVQVLCVRRAAPPAA